jgi:hypothetical protein
MRVDTTLIVLQHFGEKGRLGPFIRSDDISPQLRSGLIVHPTQMGRDVAVLCYKEHRRGVRQPVADGRIFDNLHFGNVSVVSKYKIKKAPDPGVPFDFLRCHRATAGVPSRFPSDRTQVPYYLAGTTGLEPATSAVTVNWKRVTVRN